MMIDIVRKIKKLKIQKGIHFLRTIDSSSYDGTSEAYTFIL
jgi:hypothetical protein